MPIEVLKSVEDLRNQLEQARSSLKSTDENIKRLIGRDPSELPPRNLPLKRPLEDKILPRTPPKLVRRNELFTNNHDFRRQKVNFEGSDHPKRKNPNSVFSRLSEKIEVEEPRPQKALISKVIVTPKEVPSRQKALDEQNKDVKFKERNKRMFGALLGTLQKFQQEETKQKKKVDKKAQIEKKIEEHEIKEKEEIRKEKQELFYNRRKKQTEIRILEIKMLRMREYNAWEEKQRPRLNYIVTKAKPHIQFLPRRMDDKSKELLQKSAEEIEIAIASRREAVSEELIKIEETMIRNFEHKFGLKNKDTEDHEHDLEQDIDMDQQLDLDAIMHDALKNDDTATVRSEVKKVEKKDSESKVVKSEVKHIISKENASKRDKSLEKENNHTKEKDKLKDDEFSEEFDSIEINRSQENERKSKSPVMPEESKKDISETIETFEKSITKNQERNDRSNSASASKSPDKLPVRSLDKIGLTDKDIAENRDKKRSTTPTILPEKHAQKNKDSKSVLNKKADRSKSPKIEPKIKDKKSRSRSTEKQSKTSSEYNEMTKSRSYTKSPERLPKKNIKKNSFGVSKSPDRELKKEQKSRKQHVRSSRSSSSSSSERESKRSKESYKKKSSVSKPSAIKSNNLKEGNKKKEQVRKHSRSSSSSSGSNESDSSPERKTKKGPKRNKKLEKTQSLKNKDERKRNRSHHSSTSESDSDSSHRSKSSRSSSSDTSLGRNSENDPDTKTPTEAKNNKESPNREGFDQDWHSSKDIDIQQCDADREPGENDKNQDQELGDIYSDLHDDEHNNKETSVQKNDKDLNPDTNSHFSQNNYQKDSNEQDHTEGNNEMRYQIESVSQNYQESSYENVSSMEYPNNVNIPPQGYQNESNNVNIPPQEYQNEPNNVNIPPQGYQNEPSSDYQINTIQNHDSQGSYSDQPHYQNNPNVSTSYVNNQNFPPPNISIPPLQPPSLPNDPNLGHPLFPPNINQQFQTNHNLAPHYQNSPIVNTHFPPHNQNVFPNPPQNFNMPPMPNFGTPPPSTQNIPVPVSYPNDSMGYQNNPPFQHNLSRPYGNQEFTSGGDLSEPTFAPIQRSFQSAPPIRMQFRHTTPLRQYRDTHNLVSLTQPTNSQIQRPPFGPRGRGGGWFSREGGP